MAVINDMEVRGVIVGVFQENCWIIASPKSKEAIVIDPGDEPETIFELAKDMGVNIKMIVNSHAHADHILAVNAVKHQYNAPFYMHSLETDVLSASLSGIYSRLGREEEPPPTLDAYLKDGDKVDVSGLSLQVIHTPGHTPGSTSFYTNGLLFSGDTLFRQSIGRTDMPGGDGQLIIQSIKQKLLTLPEETIVLPGHMQETTIRQEKYTNPFVGTSM